MCTDVIFETEYSIEKKTQENKILEKEINDLSITLSDIINKNKELKLTKNKIIKINTDKMKTFYENMDITASKLNNEYKLIKNKKIFPLSITDHTILKLNENDKILSIDNIVLTNIYAENIIELMEDNDRVIKLCFYYYKIDDPKIQKTETRDIKFITIKNVALATIFPIYMIEKYEYDLSHIIFQNEIIIKNHGNIDYINFRKIKYDNIIINYTSIKKTYNIFSLYRI